MPELRKDPVLARWVIIAPERAGLPSVSVPVREPRRHHGGQSCPFCLGNEWDTPVEVLRYLDPEGGGKFENWAVRAMPNKFPALKPETELTSSTSGIYEKLSGVGVHEVLVETPRHDVTMGDLSDAQVELAARAYRERIEALSRDSRLRYVLLFKNSGRVAGASQEHAHSQIIATPVVPQTVLEEMAGAESYYRYKGRCAYCDLVRQEQGRQTRIYREGKHFVALAPFASRFPYEMIVLPKEHQADFAMTNDEQLAEFARLTRDCCAALARVLHDPPYNFMIHTAPTRHSAAESYHWHLEIVPRVIQLAGFEWGSGFYVNPVPPEDAARLLR